MTPGTDPEVGRAGGEDHRWRAAVYRALDGEEPLWPELFSREKLQALRREAGAAIFASQYQNRPADVEEGMFRSEWFRHYRPGELLEEELRTYIGVDPAISRKQTADYFAVVVVGADEGGRFYVLETLRRRLSFRQQVERLAELGGRFSPVAVAVESVAYQEVLGEVLQEELHLPVRKVKPARDKASRAARLAVLFETGRIFLAEWMGELEEELVSFPGGAHDDLVDALVYAVEAAGGGRRSRPLLPRLVRGI